jgi:hypothetical protein
MAESCKQQLVRVEETVYEPIDKWVEQQEKRCRNEPCKWWMLCLNKLVCWVVTKAVKVTTWVAKLIVRWAYRIFVTAVSVVIGILAIFIGKFDIIIQALKDLLELIVDAIYFAIGALIFVLIISIDFIQTIFGFEKKRKLTEDEIKVLEPIFGDSLLYFLIRIVEKPGILRSIDGNPRAFTIGYNIYPPVNSMKTLVHECVHVWQFQYAGTQYIGQSMVQQAIGGKATYDWKTTMGQDDNAWYLLDSNEAKASFIDNVFSDGTFSSGGIVDDSDGAFFATGKKGTNNFQDGGVDYTVRANHAWDILKT